MLLANVTQYLADAIDRRTIDRPTGFDVDVSIGLQNTEQGPIPMIFTIARADHPLLGHEPFWNVMVIPIDVAAKAKPWDDIVAAMYDHLSVARMKALTEPNGRN
jgi:hypothetical protein